MVYMHGGNNGVLFKVDLVPHTKLIACKVVNSARPGGKVFGTLTCIVELCMPEGRREEHTGGWAINGVKMY